MPKNKKKQESSSSSDSDDGPVDVSFRHKFDTNTLINFGIL